jgi:hypothetical protein
MDPNLLQFFIWGVIERTNLDANRTTVVIVKVGETFVIIDRSNLPMVVMDWFF